VTARANGNGGRAKGNGSNGNGGHGGRANGNGGNGNRAASNGNGANDDRANGSDGTHARAGSGVYEHVAITGAAGAIGAALCASDWLEAGATTRFRGYDAIESLDYTSTTNEHTTCNWCPVSCKRTFIDVRLPGGQGRPWSKVSLAPGWERVISGNSCPKGLLEDVNEMRVVKKNLEAVKDAHPNTAEMVRETAFRRAKVPS